MSNKFKDMLPSDIALYKAMSKAVYYSPPWLTIVKAANAKGLQYGPGSLADNIKMIKADAAEHLSINLSDIDPQNPTHVWHCANAAVEALNSALN